jgi:NAD-dependent dihydropyrimidine dehydrogenase PreA subunit
VTFRDVLQAVFRMAPWPTEAGLREIGRPGPDSPVLVTCNYDLTVRRVSRALAGCDAWLVVAPSAGINVWCAAAGGHFGTHQVVTALKTSGIGDRVEHRRVILPQLAATGVERLEVKRRCGWNATFGPVDASDLPRYLEQGRSKDDTMRRVSFGAFERSEMALAWGGPAALLLGGGGGLMVDARYALALVLLSLVLAFGLFAVYDRIPSWNRFPASRRLLFGAGALTLSPLAGGVAGGGVAAFGAMAVAAVILSLILTFDYEGSTPIEGGSHFDERRFEIALDLDRCKGVYSCWEVCPEACFEIPEPGDVDVDLAAAERKGRPPILLAHDDRCVRCGACIVQCPLDALAFETKGGERIEPETIRRFKLNLLGARSVS